MVNYFDFNVWYCGITWPGGMRFFILLAKTAFGKKKTLHGIVVLFLCKDPRADFQVGGGANANP